MNVFTFDSYKAYLKSYLEENKQRGIVSQVAAACGCDRTYLSQVLGGKADLTPDHLIQFCDHEELSEGESRFLLLLLLRERASSTAAKRSFGLKIETLRKENLILKNKLSKQETLQEISEEDRNRYYSNWIYIAIHILTSVPSYQTPAAIAEKLGLSVAQATRVLKDLVEMRLVRKEKDRFEHSGRDFFLTQDNAQIHAHHLSWRIRAVERSMNTDDVHYTNVFTVSRGDVEKLKNKILEFIGEQRKSVRESGSEVLCAFCCDYFAM